MKGKTGPRNSHGVEEALQQERVFTNAVVDSVPGLLYLYDEDGRLVRWNKKHELLTGYSAEELAGMRITDWFRGEEIERIRQHVETALREGYAEGESKLVVKDGTVIPYYFTGVRLTLDGKRYIAGIGIDITRQKAAEEYRRGLLQALDQSPVNVIMTDPQGNIEYVNRKFCQLTGYTPEEVFGKNPRILKSGHTSAQEYAALWQTLLSTGEWSGEFLNKAKDGALFWERAHIVSIKDEAGRVAHYLSIKEDITQNKEIEEKLHKMRLQLTHVARLSTLGEMAAELAHELNHPLYAILNYAKACRNVLAEGGTPDLDSLREWTEEIAEIATSAGQAVARLRSFARRAESPRTECRIEEIINETLRLVAFEIRRSSVRVETSFAKDVPPVSVDRVQIQQVIVNLLTNAIEAMSTLPATERRIAIRTSFHDQEIEVAVSDHGIGLPSEDAAKLFEPYVTTKPKGVGMGLSIARTIIESHGGRFWARPNDGRGATFSFTIPLGNGGMPNGL